MDRALRKLEQLTLAAPSDSARLERLRGHLQRLADLHDREAWAEAPPAAQDVVLAAVGRLLGGAYERLPAEVYEAGGVRHRIGAYRHRRSGVVLHLLPGGPFAMGSSYGPRSEATTPVHDVTVPPLLIGRFPILQREWDRVGGEDERAWRGPDHPIESVSFSDTWAWLARAGDGLRLPTEAEWEYACRAGTRTEYFWGQEMDPRYCWFGDARAWKTHAPAEHLGFPNGFGLVDMAGNVGEWCADRYVQGYRQAPTDGSAFERWWARAHVVRGGDGFNRAGHCRSAHRNMAVPATRAAGIGFRVARSAPI